MEYLKNVIDRRLQFASSTQSSGEESSGSGDREDSLNNNNNNVPKKDGRPPSSRSARDSSPTSSEEELWNGEVEWPIEEDEFSFELPVPTEFINELIYEYGHQPGADLSRLVGQEKTIKINLDTAYEIFGLVYNSVMKECCLSGKVSSMNSFELSMDEEDLHFINTYLSNAKQEESDRKFAIEIDNQVNGNTTPSAFRDILANEKEKVDRELKAYKELTSVKWTMAQNIKCSQLKTLFPSLKPELVKEVFVQHKFDYDNSLVSLRDVYPSQYVDKVKESQPVKQPTESKNDWFYDPEVVARLGQFDKAAFLEQASIWNREANKYKVEFKRLTAEALSHPRNVRSLYNYKLVDASRSKELMMEAWNQYSYFNLIGLNGGNNNPNKLDLHGMRATKAVETVSKYLLNRKSALIKLAKGDSCEVLIITGAGKHSPNHEARLYPAVKNFLNTNQYKYSEGYGDGSFVIRLM